MSKNKLLIILLATFLVSFALAVPVIQVIVQKLGAGTSVVLSPANKAVVNYVFVFTNNKIELAYVKIKFDQTLTAGSYIRVELRDAQENTLAYAEVTLQNDLQSGTAIQLELNPHLGITGIMSYDHIVVVVSGAEVSL